MAALTKVSLSKKQYFLSDGFPAFQYLSIESVDNATATGILSSLTTPFERFCVLSFEKSLLGLNCNGASVNMGQFGGLGALIKEDYLA